MADKVDEPITDGNEKPETDAANSPQEPGENDVPPKNVDAIEVNGVTALPSEGAEALEPNDTPATTDAEPAKTVPSTDKPEEDVKEDDPVEVNPPTATEDVAELSPSSNGVTVKEDNPPFSGEAPAAAVSPSPDDVYQIAEITETMPRSDAPTEEAHAAVASPSADYETQVADIIEPMPSGNAPLEEIPAASPSPDDESQVAEAKETVLSGDEPKEDAQPSPKARPPEPAEAELVDDTALKTASQPSDHAADDEPSSVPAEASNDENKIERAGESAEEAPQIASMKTEEQTEDKSRERLEELVRKASESTNQKKAKAGNPSLTARLYEEQIRTGKLNRLTSVVRDEDGTKRLLNPGAVPHLNTVNITLTGKRPMPSEKCRKSQHNCFVPATGRRERALSAGLTHGLYPDLMKLNPKLNEFVAASIMEKLRLKGLAAPLHLYKGRSLPADVLAEMVLKPKKKRVTDRYYFGYVPPPNRPRVSTEFRQYLQQFAERHQAAENDLCFSHALKRVRRLAEQSDDYLSLPETLAEVVRARTEPGFGVKRLRRPHTAVI